MNNEKIWEEFIEMVRDFYDKNNQQIFLKISISNFGNSQPI